MKYEYYFYELYRRYLEEYLQTKGIKYEYIKYDSDVVRDALKFSVWSNNENYETILEELRSLNVSISPMSVYVSYSASELNNAKYLVMYPKKQVVDIINCDEAYEYSCKWISSMGVEKVNHKEQVATFAIRKEPSSKTSTAFWAEDTGFSELFTDKRVYELAKAHSLKGIGFEHIRDKKGVYSTNIFQVKTSNIIKKECIGFGYGERKEVCQICGKEQFYIDNIYQLHLDFSKIDEENDLYMTESMWGEGIAYPIYIISQKFYQLLKRNKLAGGIEVSPVVEIYN